MRGKNGIIVAIVALALMIGVSVQAAEPIKVGAILAVTGPASFLGGPESKTLTIRITSYNVCYTKLLRDGRWFAYRLSPAEGNSELVVRNTSDDTEHRFPVGEVAGGGFGAPSGLGFSDDSRAYDSYNFV